MSSPLELANAYLVARPGNMDAAREARDRIHTTLIEHAGTPGSARAREIIEAVQPAHTNYAAVMDGIEAARNALVSAGAVANATAQPFKTLDQARAAFAELAKGNPRHAKIIGAYASSAKNLWIARENFAEAVKAIAEDAPAAPDKLTPVVPPPAAAPSKPTNAALLAQYRATEGIAGRAAFFQEHRDALTEAMRVERTMSRAEFNTLTPTKKMAFCKNGGQLTD